VSPSFDLFDAAQSNAGLLHEQFKALCDSRSSDKPRLQAFAEHVENEGRIAINMRMSVLGSFLSVGRHVNVYEWAAFHVTYSSRSREEFLREKLDKFYEQRIAFDVCLGGERLRYGALNSGGIGASNYGEFCVVFQDSFVAKAGDLAYLRADSLKTYLLPGVVVDENGLSRDVAPHSHRQYLAALKHASEACALPADRWPALLCSSHEYMEVLFVESPSPADVEVIRLSHLDHEGYFYFAFEEARGKLSEVERHLVDDFKLILQLLRKHALTLEVV
jgi:hypothetical protein